MPKSKVFTTQIECSRCHNKYEEEIIVEDVTKETIIHPICIHCGHSQEIKYTPSPEEQPNPIPNESKPVWEMVMDDMKERDNFGRKRYGTPLQVGNGRDFMEDAYQEALDLVVYLRGELELRRRTK